MYILNIYSLLVFLLIAAALFAVFRIDRAYGKAAEKKRQRELKRKSLYMSKNGKLRAKLMQVSDTISQSREYIGMSITRYRLFCGVSAVAGYVVGSLIYGGNFLAFVIAAAFLFAPAIYVWYSASSQRSYELDKLQSSMFTVTNSYIVTEDIEKTIRDTLDIVEYPAPFRTFLIQSTYLTADTKDALKAMSDTVDNAFFKQWVDALILSQDDRSMRFIAMNVCDSMADVRRLKAEAQTDVTKTWYEYLTLISLLFAMPLIFRLLLAESYSALTDSVFGKICFLMLVAAVIFSLVRSLLICKEVME